MLGHKNCLDIKPDHKPHALCFKPWERLLSGWLWRLWWSWKTKTNVKDEANVNDGNNRYRNPANGYEACCWLKYCQQGPLVTETGSFYTLIGVVSWGQGCAQVFKFDKKLKKSRFFQSNAPGVYARVTSQLSWVKSRITGTTCSAW